MQQHVTRAQTSAQAAYDEVDEAIERLVYLAWDRWHPRNPETQGSAPPDVYAALRDLRAISHELEALWVLLGNRVFGLGRFVPDRDLKSDDGLPDDDVLDELDDDDRDDALDLAMADEDGRGAHLQQHDMKGDVA